MFFYASANFMISVFSYTIIIYIYVLLFFFNGFREEEVDRFSELREFLEKFFKLLFVIIAFKTTAIGQEFSTKHPMLWWLVLYFLMLLLGTMLRNRIERLPKILFWIMLVIGISFGFDHYQFTHSLLSFHVLGWHLCCDCLLQFSRALSIIYISSFRYNQ